MGYSVDTKVLHFGYRAISGTYTLLATDILLDCTSGTFTISLPPAASVVPGYPYTIKNSGTGYITLDGNASETIDGASTIIFGQFRGYEITSNGTNWIVTGVI